jgi:hypothetical protein
MYTAYTHTPHTLTQGKEIRSLAHGCEVVTGLHIMSKKNSMVDCDAEVEKTDSIL